MSTFKLLEHEGFKIARCWPGTRRSIKYEDRTQSLVLDVKLPDSAWVWIYPDQVRAATKHSKTERVPAVSEILQLAIEELPAVAPNRAENLGDGDDEMGEGKVQE